MSLSISFRHAFLAGPRNSKQYLNLFQFFNERTALSFLWAFGRRRNLSVNLYGKVKEA